LSAPAESGSGSPLGSRRLSEHDRDELIDLLARHSAEGRLSNEELERRVGAAYEAQSRDDARALLADLPPLSAEPRRARRGRGHAETNLPHISWLATDERFRDPTTQRIMRVWVDPSDGSRHYIPDQAE
jgi:hypothetical protein